MSRFRSAAVAGVVLVPLVVGGFMVQNRRATEGARLFQQVYSLVSDRFVDTVDAATLYEKAARGLVQQMQDPYTELLSPKQVSEFNRNTAGRYGGLGMQIEPQEGKGTVVSRVFPNTPAENAGIQEGDWIVGVDTVNTRGFTTQKVQDLLLGTPGTKVSATFARPGVATPIKATFTRALIHVPAVPYSLTFDQGKIGYVYLQSFNEKAAEEVAAGIRKVTADGAKGIVLDLRGNPGGFLDQALTLSNIFLRPGQEIASVRGRGVDPQVYNATQRPLVPEVPLVVLIDGYSASASEIVAGALQDHDRALIVGTTSFGKGLVQTLFNLDGGWALKMTTAKWFTPSGRSIQKERKLDANGNFVEVHPDSLESDSARKARPTFRSDAGRVVYGGGAVTPDLVVKPDTLTAPEQEFARALAPKFQPWYTVLSDFAHELKPQVKSPEFTVDPTWRDQLYSRLQKAGVTFDRQQYDAAGAFVDRAISNRVAKVTFGDSTVRRRSLDDDPQLRTALEVLRKGQTQKDLFAVARITLPAAAPARPE
jgi:carboxyl-terminal processing protease